MFTSPAVVRALTDDKKRGVDVEVLIDDLGNHSRSSTVAMKLIADTGITIRTISAYAFDVRLSNTPKGGGLCPGVLAQRYNRSRSKCSFPRVHSWPRTYSAIW